LADPELVDTLLDIIDNLLTALKDELDMLTRTHNTRVADLEKAEERLDNDVAEATANIAAAEGVIANLESDDVSANLRVQENQ